MYIFQLRELFENLKIVSIHILPAFALWILFFIILKVKKADKKSFANKFHRITLVIMLVAIAFPFIGSLITEFGAWEQRQFKSYEHFVGGEPANRCDFGATMPEGSINAEYYSYVTPIDIGFIVCLDLQFEDNNYLKEYYHERLDYWDIKNEDSEHVTYLSDASGINGVDINEEKLTEALCKMGDESLDKYKILLYYEDKYDGDYRWILLCEESNSLVEIVINYTDW
ncbi:MAG: hypothetical protein IJZ42_02410 [Lachnospiraceae bacterium]|nr:hypothetical protein [Lachnospiraceae bacterium]